MFDGVVRTLQNVRYIPEIQVNLISVGELDSGGFKCVIDGGVFSVFNSEKEVLRAKQQNRNLYVL
jgi:hypothetical protein